jgi:holo-[acyl-carrier protein] synthase
MRVKIGLDLVAVASVAESIDRHAASYLERVFTSEELDDCTGPGAAAPDPARLAARFAAKEATLKVLAGRDDAIPWQSIGVRRGDDGAPSLELTGAAACAARERGIEELNLSMTHEGPFAAAVVVATLGPKQPEGAAMGSSSTGTRGSR